MKDDKPLGRNELIAKLYAKLEQIEDESLNTKSSIILSECRKICHKLLHTDDSEDTGSEPSTPAPKEKKENPSLLIVDDDKDIQNLLKFVLKRHNFNITSETNPNEALKKIDEINPDIILLDIMMPDMTGFEFLQLIKNKPNRSHFKVLVGTSRTFDKDRIATFEAGADDFISKPYNMDELALRLTKLLS